MAAAEATFAAICENGKPVDALNELLIEVDDATEVHRVVLVSRAWDMINFVGAEARPHDAPPVGPLLRQGREEREPREELPAASRPAPKLLDQHKLMGTKPGTKSADDAWIEKFANTIFASKPEVAADAVAAALAEGIDAEAIGEAISLAANQLVLRDEGRPKEWTAANKPVGSVHGDSVGVHSCDTIHAWRNLSRRRRPAHAGHEPHPGRLPGRPRPHQPRRVPEVGAVPAVDAREKVKGVAADALMKALEAAIRDKDQAAPRRSPPASAPRCPTAGKDVFGAAPRLRGQRGRRAPRREVLRHDLGRVRHDAAGLPVAATGRPRPRHRQRLWLPAPGHDEACKLVKKA